MKSISSNKEFVFNTDNSNSELYLNQATLVTNILLKVQTESALKNSFALNVTFVSVSGISTVIPFNFMTSPVNIQYLIPGKNSNNEKVIANFIKVEFIGNNDLEIKFNIEAFYLTEEERASYEKNGLTDIINPAK